MFIDWVVLVKFANGIGLNILLMMILIAPVLIWPKQFELKPTFSAKFIRGLWAGLIVSLILFFPTNDLEEFKGFQIDTRQPVLTVIAYFFGPIATIVMMIIAMGSRMVMGGAGVMFGIWSIVACALVGAVGKKLIKTESKGSHALFFYFLGFMAVLLWNLSNIFLPNEVRHFTWNEIAPYMFFVFPLLTMFLGTAIFSSLRNVEYNEKRRSNSEAYERLFDKMDLPLIAIRNEGVFLESMVDIRIHSMNNHAKNMLSTQVVKSNNLLDLFIEPPEKIVDQIQRTISGEENLNEIETIIRDKNGVSRTVMCSVIDYSPKEQERKRIALAFRDVTNEHRLEQLNFRIKYTDPLTGIGNRILLEDSYLDFQKKHTNGVVTLIAIHVVDLFQLNASIGLKLSDKLLQEIAATISIIVEDSDVICGKLSGATFGLLFIDDDKHKLSGYIIEQITNKLSRQFMIDDFSIQPQLQVGMVRQNGLTFKEMLASARISMGSMSGQETGSISFSSFDSSAYDQYMRQLEITQELKHTLDNGLLDVYYQPIVCAKNGEIRKAEALVRWHHPVLGFISPAEFIPIAERIGLIGRIGKSIREQVVADLIKWREQGISLSISINVSPLELNNSGFSIRQFEMLLDQNKLDHDLLTFEITEMSMVDNTGVSRKWFDSVSESKFSVAIDDFGVGYSSLAQLDRVEADFLKIDKSFIDDIEINETKLEVVRNVINIAHTYNLTVVVEGVENQEQVRILNQVQCDLLQGFYFHKPMPARHISKLFSKKNKEVNVVDGTISDAGNPL